MTSHKNDSYLLARYTQVVRRGVDTRRAGWKDDPNNLQWDEHVELVLGLKRRHCRDSHVILNLSEKTVVQNWKSGQNPADYEQLLGYYLKNYEGYIRRWEKQLGVSLLKT